MSLISNASPYWFFAVNFTVCTVPVAATPLSSTYVAVNASVVASNVLAYAVTTFAVNSAFLMSAQSAVAVYVAASVNFALSSKTNAAIPLSRLPSAYVAVSLLPSASVTVICLPLSSVFVTSDPFGNSISTVVSLIAFTDSTAISLFSTYIRYYHLSQSAN